MHRRISLDYAALEIQQSKPCALQMDPNLERSSSTKQSTHKYVEQYNISHLHPTIINLPGEITKRTRDKL